MYPRTPLESIRLFHDELTAIRRDLHAHPELGFEEVRTSGIVAGGLEALGIEVHRGIGKTGVVGVIRGKGCDSGRMIGLRADMDALPMTEDNAFGHRSTKQGLMHGCGHDGHTTMLLGAARYLAQTRNFDGTAVLIFQPAEEGRGGAKAMLEDGLFDTFPCDAIYALHNWPGLPVGTLAVNPDAMMASLDSFEITLHGKSCHAAMPESGADPMVVAAELILALQTIPSRRLSPLASAVVSVTQIHGGEAINVIPEQIVLRGTVRCLQTDVRNRVRGLIEDFVTTLPRPFGVSGEIHWYPGYPVTANHADQAEQVRAVAVDVLGEAQVHWQVNPSMASEDFACMLQACPGAYFWLGADGATPSAPLHNANYDFNDELLPIGITFWQQLVERVLAKA